MNRNPLLASISWRMTLSLALVVALSLACGPSTRRRRSDSRLLFLLEC